MTKIEIETTKSINVATLHVEAGVRYWEDSYINGNPDTENGDKVPFKEGNLWKPVIDVSTGTVIDWPTGVTADIHYKVCDEGSYYLKDENGNTVASIIDGYVPRILYPKEDGCGDYIIMDIDAFGKIENWKIDLTAFFNH